LTDIARKLAELARISETLEVQQNDVGVRIVRPVLNQVVAGHVGFVPIDANVEKPMFSRLA
jgi:hypothetical protein